MDYRVFSAATVQVGGMMALTADMQAGGARPCWASYISVDDVSAAVAAITSAGGSVLMGPSEVPGIGPFAFVADPAGAFFYVMDDQSGQPSEAFAKYAPRVGHAAWNELATSDQTGAWSFYGKLFGWVHEGELDMGPMGQYQFIKSDVGIGAIMPKMPDMPVSYWTTYFRVADIDAAAAAVTAGGGTVLVEPMEIPGGDYSCNATDPQGAIFGLVGPRA